MSRFFQNGGDSPVVGRKPTGSDSTAQLFLANGEWSKEDSLKSAIDLTCVSPSSVRYFEMGQDNAFHIGHVTKHDEDGFYLYTESQSHLSINGEPITGDPAKISGVLANYKFGGMPAVLAYLDSLSESGEVSAPVHDYGPTLVVEPVTATPNSNPPLFLAAQEWSYEAVLEKAESVFRIDCTSPYSVDIGGDCTIELGDCLLADGPEFQVWYRTQIWAELHHNSLKVEPEVLGDVLANYEYGGVEAVEAYLESH